MTHDVDEPGKDADWNYNARRETTTARLDRNWDDMLQELRVAQTGVQILTGLLLTVPFQARFDRLEPQEIVVYLVTVALAVLASGLLISPVVLHRVLFRQHARRTLVRHRGLLHARPGRGRGLRADLRRRAGRHRGRGGRGGRVRGVRDPVGGVADGVAAPYRRGGGRGGLGAADFTSPAVDPGVPGSYGR